MLVYTNRGKQVKLNSNDVESIDVIVKDVTVGTNMLDYFEEIKNLTGNELLELVRNNFENEKDNLIEIVLRNRIK